MKERPINQLFHDLLRPTRHGCQLVKHEKKNADGFPVRYSESITGFYNKISAAEQADVVF
jgi:hypothetical protein